LDSQFLVWRPSSLLEIEKTSIRLPEELLDAFQSAVKEEWGKLKGAQNDAFSEAVLLWLSHKKSLPVVMIKDAGSGRKYVVLASQLEENLLELFKGQRPQLGIVPIATSRFPVGIISISVQILLSKLGPPKTVSIHNLDHGEELVEELETPSGAFSVRIGTADHWEDELHSKQDGTKDKLELDLSWDSPSKVHASFREDYISILKNNQYMPNATQPF
jgi:hypothetical protein